jgi:hypothetical protein
MNLKLQSQEHNHHDKEKTSSIESYASRNIDSKKPEIGELASRMSLLIQAPSFTTNYLVLAMDTQRYDVLHSPTLQDLRRLKFTRQKFREGHIP